MEIIPIQKGNTLLLCIKPEEVFYCGNTGWDSLVTHFKKRGDDDSCFPVLAFILVANDGGEMFCYVAILGPVDRTLTFSFDMENLRIDSKLGNYFN